MHANHRQKQSSHPLLKELKLDADMVTKESFGELVILRHRRQLQHLLGLFSRLQDTYRKCINAGVTDYDLQRSIVLSRPTTHISPIEQYIELSDMYSRLCDTNILAATIAHFCLYFSNEVLCDSEDSWELKQVRYLEHLIWGTQKPSKIFKERVLRKLRKWLTSVVVDLYAEVHVNME